MFAMVLRLSGTDRHTELSEAADRFEVIAYIGISKSYWLELECMIIMASHSTFSKPILVLVQPNQIKSGKITNGKVIMFRLF